jgi:NDP-sugar pyrophosphorylase family protein
LNGQGAFEETQTDCSGLRGFPPARKKVRRAGSPAALILSAGRGERLRPLTDELPKPLLPLRGRPLLSWRLQELDRLPELGFVAVNLHHLGTQIVSALGPTFRGRLVHYSFETQLLGTGGALWALRDPLSEASEVLLANGDTWGPVSWRRLLYRHRQQGAALTLLVHRKVPVEPFGGGIGVSGDRIVEARKPRLEAQVSRRKRRVYAGACVLDPSLLSFLPEGPSDWIEVLLERALDRGWRVCAVETAAPWFDIGTPQRYLEAVVETLPPGRRDRSWIHPEAVVEEGASLDRASIEAGARIGRGARLRRAVVLPRAVVGEKAALEEVIVAPGTTVEPGARLRGGLVTLSGFVFWCGSERPVSRG